MDNPDQGCLARLPCLCESISTDGIAWTAIGTEADIIRGIAHEVLIRAVAATVMSVQGHERRIRIVCNNSAWPSIVLQNCR